MAANNTRISSPERAPQPFIVRFAAPALLFIAQSFGFSADCNAQIPANSRSVSHANHVVALHEGFIRRMALLQDKITALETPAGHVSGLRTAVCSKIQVDQADCKTVLTWANHTNASLTAIDQKAQAIITSIRAQYPHRPKASSTPLLPPPPAELAQLQSQRELLVETETAKLLSSLTQNGANNLTLSSFTPKK